MQSVIAFFKPEVEFSVEINKINEGFGIKESADIPDQPLYAAFFIATVWITYIYREAVKPGKV